MQEQFQAIAIFQDHGLVQGSGGSDSEKGSDSERILKVEAAGFFFFLDELDVGGREKEESQL